MKKRSLKEEIEYRLGIYFGIKSGALYVRDEKFGNTEEILKQLQQDITWYVTKRFTRKEINVSGNIVLQLL